MYRENLRKKNVSNIFYVTCNIKKLVLFKNKLLGLTINSVRMYIELLTRRTIAHGVCSQMAAIIIEIKIEKEEKKQKKAKLRRLVHDG